MESMTVATRLKELTLIIVNQKNPLLEAFARCGTRQRFWRSRVSSLNFAVLRIRVHLADAAYDFAVVFTPVRKQASAAILYAF